LKEASVVSEFTAGPVAGGNTVDGRNPAPVDRQGLYISGD